MGLHDFAVQQIYITIHANDSISYAEEQSLYSPLLGTDSCSCLLSRKALLFYTAFFFVMSGMDVYKERISR